MKAKKINLRQNLFWDVAVESIDLSIHKDYVIERTVSRGTLEEFKQIINYYGHEVVKKSLLNTRYLDKKTLAYCSGIFKTPITKFRCYKLEQLLPQLWKY